MQLWLTTIEFILQPLPLGLPTLTFTCQKPDRQI